ncbi:group III truncated hemoglobin [Mycolicibacterium fortuitum]|uniref:Globin n=1 Tax=Mycolicibacterium fortuitum subsp. fortuitum DSM 46621 = ATCC 6841 = JCM 6387 TaxID=1214102 RepID=K0VHM5_MYCFO|nr:group III truncated hemoglobin [Mycolicibacterium fortuitum]CRL74047.1 hypothetical protein CPGR_01224 [Mycolicibacter nonchromogenicus]AMD55642.1 hypothetical protein ATO49_22550 [Mycolicibacterium fortuitum subsp. fortuitum DSM 46621 = ATCC 6841 = JCM 6387]EJZ10619.1 hypothetical protein MFORT_20148 [Mycolicibacterium fortuitum subsp. fortuitum DSM 46621 = ATCC 6841 = JCM 6387]WEV31663.1 group III truncated hemoglobin [Mycolicibacterium fortuitum]CRL58216.1 hypothetical protein CPGR_05559
MSSLSIWQSAGIPVHGAMHTDSRRQLVNRADIEQLVRIFYTRALSDEKLFKYFLELRFGELEDHLTKIADYWDTKLFQTARYQENSLQVHLRLNALHELQDTDFQRWIELWRATVNELFVGRTATKAKIIGAQMCCIFYARITGTHSPELEGALLTIAAEELTEQEERK